MPGKTNFFSLSFREKHLKVELNTLATKCDNSVLIRYGNTTVLTALTFKELEFSNSIYFPLTVNFEERFYSIGKIPGSFSKREGKPSHDAIIAARMIDRTIRPFFQFPTEIEVNITNHVLSLDSECDARMVAAWGSSLVCLLSEKLSFFQENIVTLVNKKTLFNDLEKENLQEIVVSFNEEKIVMLELNLKEKDEEWLVQQINELKKEALEISIFFSNILKEVQTSVIPLKASFPLKELTENELKIKQEIYELLAPIVNSKIFWKEKEKQLKEAYQKIIFFYTKREKKIGNSWAKNEIETIFDLVIEQLMSEVWKNKKIRIDGRKIDEIRPLKISSSYLENVHGSALFERGETKVLSITTVGKIKERQLIDTLKPRYKNFIHHYNFPGFAVNEIFAQKGISRREIGHGELVEKTFTTLIPWEEVFPYTVRVVSEVFSSDGSSSQASICATSLSLFSAGISFLKPVAGISLGLFENEIFVDINGLEDKFWEMDFKVAGTKEGLISLQLDVKNKGITIEIFSQALQKGKRARIFLLAEMNKELEKLKEKNLPNDLERCEKIFIGKENLHLIIGSGGKNINQIILETGVSIEKEKEGWLLIYYKSQEQLEKAIFLFKKTMLKNGRTFTRI